MLLVPLLLLLLHLHLLLLVLACGFCHLALPRFLPTRPHKRTKETRPTHVTHLRLFSGAQDAHAHMGKVIWGVFDGRDASRRVVDKRGREGCICGGEWLLTGARE